MVEIVKGRVAQIVSDREVILNRGSADGVAPGMFFKVLDPSTFNIKDPETGEVLGSLSRVTIVLEAVEVTERLTVARTFRSQEVNVGGTGGNLLGSLMSPPKYVRRFETLRRSSDEPAPIAERESVVKVGDPFESATPEEVEDTRSVSLWRDAAPGEVSDTGSSTG